MSKINTKGEASVRVRRFWIDCHGIQVYIGCTLRILGGRVLHYHKQLEPGRPHLNGTGAPSPLPDASALHIIPTISIIIIIG